MSKRASELPCFKLIFDIQMENVYCDVADLDMSPYYLEMLKNLLAVGLVAKQLVAHSQLQQRGHFSFGCIQVLFEMLEPR